jgi:CubicO group peptidase (beta-lactamase class C family)
VSGGPAHVSGWVAPGYERLRDAFAEAHGPDAGGAQLSVFRGGREVAALYAGPHEPGVLCVAMSCSKGVMAILMQMLAAEGALDVDDPVAAIWPAFAAGGKEAVQLRHLLTHQAGLFTFEPQARIGPEAYADWERCTRALEAMTPFWEPGSAYAYHFATWGFLAGEVMRRVSRLSPGDLVRRRIAGPLGVEFMFGAPAEVLPRVALNERTRPAASPEQLRAILEARGVDLETRIGAAAADMYAAVGKVVETLNAPTARMAQIPALAGICDARALAAIYAAVIGSVGGVRLLGAEAIERLRSPQSEGLGPPPGLPLPKGAAPQRLGLGVELPNPNTPMLGEGSFGHAGIGGQIAFAHPEAQVSAAYLCSRMLWDASGPDARWVPWTEALRELASA